MEQMRVVFIWAFFLSYSGVGHETFSLVKLGGFALIILGVLTFNKVIQCDCLGSTRQETTTRDASRSTEARLEETSDGANSEQETRQAS